MLFAIDSEVLRVCDSWEKEWEVQSLCPSEIYACVIQDGLPYDYFLIGYFIVRDV